MNRRDFLFSLAGVGAFLPHCLGSSPVSARTLRSPGPSPSGPHGYDGEAARLTRALMDAFWDGGAGMFRAPVPSTEAVPSDPKHNNGYVFWPSLLGLHALIEGERNQPGRYTRRVAGVYQGLEQYFNPALHAYNAWLASPTNRDSYYDDNAWAVITLVEAHNATRRTDPAQARSYLGRAADVMAHYVRAGWDSSGRPGGVRWGADPARPATAEKATSATAGAALAALMLARAGVDVARNTRWGGDVLAWLAAHLMDTDGLMMDALVPPDWTARKIKYTYNTGVPLRAYVEHYRLTGSQDSLQQATRLARAALDHRGGLFDGLVRDPGRRFYYDGGYFVHYLVDGLLQLRRETRDRTLAAALAAEATRNADYAYRYLRDSADGLYWRNWRLWRIGPTQLHTWEALTGQTTRLDPDPAERASGPTSMALPVERRPLVKTLLANAGTARLFWLMSRM